MATASLCMQQKRGYTADSTQTPEAKAMLRITTCFYGDFLYTIIKDEPKFQMLPNYDETTERGYGIKPDFPISFNANLKNRLKKLDITYA